MEWLVLVVVVWGLKTPQSDLDVQTPFAECIVNIVNRYHNDDHPMQILAFHFLRLHNYEFPSFSQLLLRYLYTHTNSTVLQIEHFEGKADYGGENYTKEVLQVWLGKEKSDISSPNLLIIIATMINPMGYRNIEKALHDYMYWARNNQNSMHTVMLMMPLSRTLERVTADLYGQGIMVYTWYQDLQIDPCYRGIHRPDLVDNWSPSMRRFQHNRNLYPRKVRHIDGCDLLIGIRYVHPLIFHKVFYDNMTDTKQRDGIFLRVFQLVAKKHDLKLEFDTFRIGEPIRKLDLYDAVGPTVLDDENANYFQPMKNLYRMGYTFLVPPGAEIPLWLSPVRVFPPLMWGLVISAYFLGSMTFWLLERQRDVSDVMLNTLGSQLGTSMQQALKGVVPIALFTIWLFYCLLIYTAYQSSLIGFITSPGIFPPIKNLAELQASKLELGTILKFTRNRSAEDLGIPQEWRYGKAVFCGNLNYYKCFDRVAYSRDLAVLVDRSVLYSWYLARYWVLGVPLIVPLEEDVNEVYLTMYFKKESPLLLYFSQTLTRIQEAGIADKWHKDVRENFTKFSRIGYVDTSMPVRFNLTHVQGPFFMLMLGLLFACCVFCVEYMMKRKTARQ